MTNINTAGKEITVTIGNHPQFSFCLEYFNTELTKLPKCTTQHELDCAIARLHGVLDGYYMADVIGQRFHAAVLERLRGLNIEVKTPVPAHSTALSIAQQALQQLDEASTYGEVATILKQATGDIMYEVQSANIKRDLGIALVEQLEHIATNRGGVTR